MVHEYNLEQFGVLKSDYLLSANTASSRQKLERFCLHSVKLGTVFMDLKVLSQVLRFKNCGGLLIPAVILFHIAFSKSLRDHGCC
jgi:hypothetical protein